MAAASNTDGWALPKMVHPQVRAAIDFSHFFLPLLVTVTVICHISSQLAATRSEHGEDGTVASIKQVNAGQTKKLTSTSDFLTSGSVTLSASLNSGPGISNALCILSMTILLPRVRTLKPRGGSPGLKSPR